MNLDIFKNFTQRTIQPGEVIFRENDPGEVMYIILSGRVAIIKQVMEGVHKTLGVLGIGEYFGEMSLLLKADRSATARAVEQTTLAQVSRDMFRNILKDHLDVGVNLLIQLAHRLEKANQEAILLALELELTKRRPERYPPTGVRSRPIIIATGSFDAQDMSEVLRLRNSLQWSQETCILASLLKPGQLQDSLVYIIETENMLEVMKLTACFKHFVRWDISFAVSTDEEQIDSHLMNG